MISDSLLIKIVREIDKSWSRRRYVALLIELRLYSLAKLRDDEEYSRLPNYDLILETLRSQVQYDTQLLDEIHMRRPFSKEILQELRDANVELRALNERKGVSSEQFYPPAHKDSDKQKTNTSVKGDVFGNVVVGNGNVINQGIPEKPVLREPVAENSKNKFSWQKVVGALAIIGAIAAIVSGLNDALSLSDRLFPPIRTITSTEIPKLNVVSEFFPLFVGSIRTYTFGKITPQIGSKFGIDQAIGSYSERVLMVESSSYDVLHAYQVEQTGEIFDLDCTGFETIKGPKKKWYITDETQVYAACNDEQKGQIIENFLDKHFNTTPPSNLFIRGPKLVFPLIVDNKWNMFPDDMPPRDDNMYVWYVETKLDMVTPAGKFSNCYRIVLYTNPDTSVQYICEGVGVVALEYHHHGMPVDYRVELTSYSATGNP